MNGIATSLVAARLRAQGDPFVEEMVEEFREVEEQRDRARNWAVRLEQELHRLESLYLALKEQGGGIVSSEKIRTQNNA